MKKILSLIVVILLVVTAGYSQSPSPGIFNYQGVARNSVGNVLINQAIKLRLTIHDGSAVGPTVYQESRAVTTNPFGLFNAQVGSAGATNVTGTIAGVNWGVGNKYIQVEIDPAGGTTFINIGTAQIASVPYALYSSLSNDLVLPFNKTQADAGTLFKITNSGTGAGSTALEGLTNSTAGNAYAIIGTVTPASPGGFSTGVRGINNGTGGLGIGVWGSQAGSGWGVYGQTPAGIGVYGLSTSGFGVYGQSTSGASVYGIQPGTGTGNAGLFQNTNAANNSPTVLITTNGTSAPALSVTGPNIWGSAIGITNTTSGMEWRTSVNGTSYLITKVSGSTFTPVQLFSTGGMDFSNTAGTSIMRLLENGNVGIGNTAPVSKVYVRGFNSTNNLYSSSTGFLGATGLGLSDVTAQPTNEKWGIHTYVDGAVGTQHAIFAEPGTTAAVNVGLFGRVSTAPVSGNSYALFAFDAINNGTTTWAANIVGRMRYADGTQGLNKILRSDANGNASWTTLAAAGLVTGTGVATRVAFWNSATSISSNANLYWDDVNSRLGIGTAAPAYPLDVIHGGATGAHIASTASFSVVDIDAFTGDAALRLFKAGVGQWNIRNRPADNYLEIFELGGGGSRMVIQDATGFVGIGGGATIAPAYQLDVENTGANGIRSKSSASFSVVDIDANSGDAALRFQKAGVGEWNTRNRPADNYYEIFELGGGGSRMVIQDATGFVGIGGGATVAPAYQLDVENTGANGIRSKSSASFSVVDIDANSGDAALRFQKAGVGEWNTRNRPADNYYEIFELGGGGSRMVIQDATGYVGIGGGATIAPAYQLDVENTGANGIRSKSSASFSVVDIDAASGDAALRFAFAGVNQWNIRNRPGDNYLEIFELGGGGSRMAIQDATGNVGIGTTGAGIAYRLDVQHGGATGIRSQSTASFSVVDIDAFSGDAALRFQKAGVGQWNTRNEPVNDDYQWFELGGGGERMRIQRATGNIGINQPAPAYKLDVLHGGATGLRVQSSATFSVIDIDGNNGDAALRFARAGVNQWNIRNNPANDDLQFFELGGGGERMRIENTTGRVWVDGDLHVDGTLSKTAGAFKIDHPLDPENKVLWHSFVESPDMMNIYNGNIVTDASGKATVQLPDYFEALNMEFRYQLTVIGAFAQAIINKEVSDNKFEIATNQPNVKVSWQVTGIRHDAYAEKHRIPNVVEKDAKDKGKYLNPEAFNQPNSKGIGYTEENKVSSLNDVTPATKKAVDPASITGGSLDYTAPKATTNKPTDNSGSVANMEPTKTVVKPVDNSGSVANTEPTKTVVKPVDNSGSVAPVESNKPSTKKLDNSGSVSDKEIQKPVSNTQAPVVDQVKNIEPAKPVKEVLPAILKGTSMDPDAKPVMPVKKD